MDEWLEKKGEKQMKVDFLNNRKTVNEIIGLILKIFELKQKIIIKSINFFYKLTIDKLKILTVRWKNEQNDIM